MKIINIKLKHAVTIIFNEDRLCHSRPLLKNLNTLNVYQVNIYQNPNFMHRLKNDRTKIMEWLFAKRRKENSILLTFSKNCKVKVNWNRKWSYVLLILFCKLHFIFNSYSLNTDQSKFNFNWELKSRAWWYGFVAFYKSFSLNNS